MRKIFCGNISWDSHEAELREHFEVCGEVADVQIRRDKNGLPSFAFITFANECDARTALVKLQGSILGERHLNIQIAARQ